LADAVQTAFFEGKGICHLQRTKLRQKYSYSNNFELDGITFWNNVHLFSFNNPYGACPVCEGYGNIIGIDAELVVPNTTLSVFENAIFPGEVKYELV
jgi:excinuclease ABC subunit A